MKRSWQQTWRDAHSVMKEQGVLRPGARVTMEGSGLTTHPLGSSCMWGSRCFPPQAGSKDIFQLASTIHSGQRLLFLKVNKKVLDHGKGKRIWQHTKFKKEKIEWGVMKAAGLKPSSAIDHLVLLQTFLRALWVLCPFCLYNNSNIWVVLLSPFNRWSIETSENMASVSEAAMAEAAFRARPLVAATSCSWAVRPRKDVSYIQLVPCVNPCKTHGSPKHPWGVWCFNTAAHLMK